MTHPKNVLIALVVASTCLILTTQLHGFRNPQDETIQLTITVKTEAGAPIANAPMSAVSHVQERFQMTDALGQATFTIVKDVNENEIMVRLTAGGFTTLVPPNLRKTATQQFHTLRVLHAFKPFYLVSTVGAGPFTADIIAREAVTVSGRILDSSGAPRSTTVAPRSSATYDFVIDSELGVFSLGGVIKGESGELWIAGANTQGHVVSLTAQQLSADLNLGDIIIDDTPTDATISLQMTNADTLSDRSKLDIRRELSLIAADDAEVHFFDARSDGQVFTGDANGTAITNLPIPAGSYYIVPGSLGRESFFALLESIRAGRQAQLDTAGVPKITVAAGGTASLVFNAQAAFDAVMTVGGDLVPPP